MNMNDVILVERDELLATVTINRPEKRNALSLDLLDILAAEFRDLSADAELAMVVLTGAGERSFAAGGDLKELESVRTFAEAAAMANRAKAALQAIRDCPVPVVAALNGDALGGGAELALACDLRVAASHARIGFLQGRLNITTAWGGGVDLIRLVGKARALSLIYSARLVGGVEGLSLGLFDAAANDGESLDTALATFLTPMRERTPQVLRAIKRLATIVSLPDGRAAFDQLETEILADSWIQPAHWQAAEGILAKA